MHKKGRPDQRNWSKWPKRFSVLFSESVFIISSNLGKGRTKTWLIWQWCWFYLESNKLIKLSRKIDTFESLQGKTNRCANLSLQPAQSLLLIHHYLRLQLMSLLCFLEYMGSYFQKVTYTPIVDRPLKIKVL